MHACDQRVPVMSHSLALTGGTRTLVMVAEPDDATIRVYRSVGFTVTEHQLSFIHQPAQSIPAKVTTPGCRATSRQGARTQRAGTGSDDGRHSRLISP